MRARAPLIALHVAAILVVSAGAGEAQQSRRVATCPSGNICEPLAIDDAGRLVVYSQPAPAGRVDFFVHDTFTGADRLVANLDFQSFLVPRMTSDGRYVLFADRPTDAHAYDTATNALIDFPAVVLGGVFHLPIDWSRDLRYVLYAVFRGDARNGQIDKLFVYDRQSSTPAAVPLDAGTPVAFARLSPDGRYVAYAVSTGTWLFDRLSGRETRLVEPSLESVPAGSSVQFTSTGQHVIAAGSTYETATGRPIARSPDGTASPSGRYIAYRCSEDGRDTTFCVYDQLTTLSSRLSAPGRLSFRIDSRRRAAVVDDLGRVVLGNADDPDEIVSMTCGSFFVPPPRVTAGASEETGIVRLTVSSGDACAWTAQSNVPWITIVSPANGVGSADIAYLGSRNTGGGARSGTLTIGGQTFFVTQTQNSNAAPGAPMGLRATNNLTGSMTWSPPVDGGTVANYVVEGGSLPGLSDLFRVSTGTATSLPISPFQFARLYMRVRATNQFGTSIASNEVVRAVIPGPSRFCNLPPDAPQQLTASVEGSSVALAWSMFLPGFVGSSFIVEAGSTSGLANLANSITGSNAQSLVAPAVPAGTYVARVRAITVCGVGPPSNEIVVNVR